MAEGVEIPHASAGVVVIENNRNDDYDPFEHVVSLDQFDQVGMADDSADSRSRVVPLAATKEFYRWMQQVVNCIKEQQTQIVTLQQESADLRQQLIDKGVL